MEQLHQGLGYRHHYIAVLFGVLSHPTGITQQQLLELTQTPRGPLSEILHDLQFIKWVKVEKRKKIRQKYYYPLISFDTYIKSLFSRLKLSYSSNLESIEPIFLRIQALKEKYPSNSEIHHFMQFLYFFKNLTSLMIEIFRNTNIIMEEKDKLEHKLNQNSDINSEVLRKNPRAILKNDQQSKLPSQNEIITIDFLTFKSKLEQLYDLKLKIESHSPSIPQNFSQNQTISEYQTIRKDFFQGIQEMAHDLGFEGDLGIIMIDILIINRPITQDDLITDTKIPRSVISYNLTRLIELRLIKVVKYPKDRRKYYHPSFTFPELLTYKIQGQFNYSNSLQQYILKLITEMDAIQDKSKDFLQFVNFLHENLMGYRYLNRYFSIYAQQLVFYCDEQIKNN
jgi:DNA-binding transcriptional regulator GbsR (MarR family)